MSLFKRAYARGINDQLIRHGLIRYRSKEAADAMADAIGDQIPAEPAAVAGDELAGGLEGMGGEGAGVSPETAADVAATLIESANKLVEETGGEGMAPPEEAPMPEEAELKTSAAQDIYTRAGQQAEAIMHKVAAEVKQAEGSTIEGGDKGNSMSDAAAAETKMEAKNRPDGKYVMGVSGVGTTQSPAGRGTGVVGDEQIPAPDAPAESPSGSNTVIQQSKLGTLREIIQKVAMGSTIMGGDKGNTMAGAPAAETQMEAANRPEGYATNMLAQTDLPVTPAATVGTEQPQPVQPGESPAGTTPGGNANSVVEFSNESKTGAANDPFIALFKKTAEEVAAHIPADLTDEQKIAHVRQMMGMNENERTEYIGTLHKEAGATDDQAVDAATKHAACSRKRRHAGNPNRKDRTRSNQKVAEMPAALAAALDKKDEKPEDKGTEIPMTDAKDKKDEGDKKDKKDDEKKEGSMDFLSRIRQISQSAHA